MNSEAVKKPEQTNLSARSKESVAVRPVQAAHKADRNCNEVCKQQERSSKKC